MYIQEAHLARQNLVLIWPGIPAIRNKAIFQRPIAFSRKFNVYIVAAGPVCKEVLKEVKGFVICPVRHKVMNQLVFPIWAVAQVLWLKRQVRMDAIVTTYANWMLIIGVFFKRMGMTWIVDLIDDPSLWLSVHHDTPGILAALGRFYHRCLFKIIKRNLSNADCTICVGSVDSMVKKYHISPKKSIEVTNGIDPSNIPTKDWIEHQKAGTCPTLLYVGHIRRKRGIGILLKALASLRDQHIKCELRLVGPIEPHEKESLVREIKSLALEEYVCLVGCLPHNEVWSEIAKATICFYPFPSAPDLDHVSPIKVFEYMAAGRAVIASNLPGVARIIVNGVSGILVPHDDHQAFVEAVKAIIHNTKLRTQLEMEACKAVLAFDWNVINKRIVEYILLSLDK